MIAKGTLHNSGSRLATYMVTGKAGEKAELWQLRGFALGDIKGAFRSIDMMAEGTRCDKPFFHVQVRNPAGEDLTRQQWEKVADRIETKLGYSGQPRAIAFHTDEATGHEHMHLAWSRIDEETLTAKPLPFFKLRLKEVCRELEAELTLTPVSNERQRPEIRSPSRAEHEQSRRLNTDIHAIRGHIRDAFDQADTGRAFAAGLGEKGLTLCQGERRDFVVIDQAGGVHALGKRVLGVSAAELRQRLDDIERDALPTIEEARQHLPAPARAEVSEVQPARDESAALIERFEQRIREQRADPNHRYHALHETHRQVAEQMRERAASTGKTDGERLTEIRQQIEEARQRERGRER